MRAQLMIKMGKSFARIGRCSRCTRDGMSVLPLVSGESSANNTGAEEASRTTAPPIQYRPSTGLSTVSGGDSGPVAPRGWGGVCSGLERGQRRNRTRWNGMVRGWRKSCRHHSERAMSNGQHWGLWSGGCHLEQCGTPIGSARPDRWVKMEGGAFIQSQESSCQAN